MTREEFRDKKSEDYRKRREDYGIKDPVFLDEIEEAYYQGMVDADKYPRWISVEDELPSEGKYAVTINKVGVQDVRLYSHGKWYSNFGNEYDDITHWMPLPEAPTVAKNATVKKGGEE